ncbi:hypothetical protein PtA15_1A10 [Puccinia triticina]|uniref:Uncharacterized protein n=1 Tax=Puccinia triticina TaxID=208348 RepID=A0ABY7C9T5_9BASI|nr:uncharacterized protein PtA15_1A10 [Puccinia triticina]WAQ80672.1 hypothetical protein PtA15_1A10 [Puccinia triticina]
MLTPQAPVVPRCPPWAPSGINRHPTYIVPLFLTVKPQWQCDLSCFALKLAHGREIKLLLAGGQETEALALLRSAYGNLEVRPPASGVSHLRVFAYRQISSLDSLEYVELNQFVGRNRMWTGPSEIQSVKNQRSVLRFFKDLLHT